jgi:basic membrane protein A
MRSPGINNLGLKEGGVDVAMDDNNKALVTPEMKAAVDKAKADIIAGTTKVHDYMSDNACPYYWLIQRGRRTNNPAVITCFAG